MLTNTNKVMLAITGYHFPQITRTDQKVSYRLKKNIFPGFSGRNKIKVFCQVFQENISNQTIFYVFQDE